MSQTHLITGVAGQDGVLLARQIKAEGNHVIGTSRPESESTRRNRPYLQGVTLIDHDIRDTSGFRTILARHRPTHVYNLAGISSVRASWDSPEEALEINGAAVVRLIDVLRDYPDVRFLQAGSAEEAGAAAESPYARGKATAHAAVTRAREVSGMFACSATLHNHESPLRGRAFVTRKITRAAAEIRAGQRKRLELGNLAIRRDWGAATDHVRAMGLMLEADFPQDFVVATGLSHSLEDVLWCAFEAAGLGSPWPFVDQNEQLLRPTDSAELVGDPRPIADSLGWAPRMTFESVITQMVSVDVRRIASGVEEDPDYLDNVSGAHS